MLVQGVGDVGGPLAEQLAADGARVLVSDVDDVRVRELSARIGAEVVAPGCGHRHRVRRLRAVRARRDPERRDDPAAALPASSRGARTTSSHEPEDSDRLRDAGILYAPDFVINAGGVLYAWGTESLGWDLDTVEARLAAIGDTLAEIYARAEAEGIGTHAAAEGLARSRSSQEMRWNA